MPDSVAPDPDDIRYIVVTGGVVSSLGKGIIAASLGMLLRAGGCNVRLQKLDPYLNLDPGTMSPFQHGEVFVTEDGAETDLDLGHYERFTGVACSKDSVHTSGQVYETVLGNERDGAYGGQTVQMIPHITDEIRRRIEQYAQQPFPKADPNKPHVVVIEIGGTVGDIESQPILEALRQLRRSIGRGRMCCVHTTLVPWLEAAGEWKTKPSQHSVALLRQLGLQPDLLVLRATETLSEDIQEKVGNLCDMDRGAVLCSPDARDIYEVPLLLANQGIVQQVLERLDIPMPPLTISRWESMCERIIGASKPVHVGIVGKYVAHQDAYISVVEAVRHAAASLHQRPIIHWVDAENVSEESVDGLLEQLDAVIVPGGFGDRGVNGKILTADWCLQHQKPFLGICLGMQTATVAWARRYAGLSRATSREWHPHSRQCVIDHLPGQKHLANTGGTMRLGAQPALLAEGTLAFDCYGESLVMERHRHRLEVHPAMVERLIDSGLVISGVNAENGLVEVVEAPRDQHPFWLGCQYHPEFRSRPVAPHPLFVGLLEAQPER